MPPVYRRRMSGRASGSSSGHYNCACMYVYIICASCRHHAQRAGSSNRQIWTTTCMYSQYIQYAKSIRTYNTQYHTRASNTLYLAGHMSPVWVLAAHSQVEAIAAAAAAAAAAVWALQSRMHVHALVILRNDFFTNNKALRAGQVLLAVTWGQHTYRRWLTSNPVSYTHLTLPTKA